MIKAAAVVVGLRYRNGAPLYDKTLQTVLGERPSRVIVVSDRSAQPEPGGSTRRSPRIARMPTPERHLPRLDPCLLDRLHRPRAGSAGDHPGRAGGARSRSARSSASSSSRSAPGACGSPRAGAPGERPRRREPPPRTRSEPLIERGLGVPGLFAAVYSVVGFSIYFALGVVADRGLGLTPLIFLAAGLLFVLTTLSYVEGGAMLRERGGSSSFARHAFNELIAFIAGWAILIDYLIVAALAAISVPHYLAPGLGPPLRGGLGDRGGGRGDRRGLRPQRPQHHRAGEGEGPRRPRPRRPRPAAGGDRRRRPRRLPSRPPHRPDRPLHQPDASSTSSTPRSSRCSPTRGSRRPRTSRRTSTCSPRDLKRIVSIGALAVPLVYAGMAAVALMAVPVVAGPDGPQTALGSEFVEAPDPRRRLLLQPAGGRGRDALDRRPGRRPRPLLGGDDDDARRLAPHLHAGDQPADPELARQAQLAPRDPAGRDRDLRGDRDRPGRADRRQAAGRDLRIRRDAGDHDRPALDPAPADDRAGPPPALPGPLERQLARRAASGSRDLRGAALAASPSSASSPTTTPPAGSAAAGWPSASSSTSSTARSSRGRR